MSFINANQRNCDLCKISNYCLNYKDGWVQEFLLDYCNDFNNIDQKFKGFVIGV